LAAGARERALIQSLVTGGGAPRRRTAAVAIFSIN
jgi:hypothetical protein